MTAALDRRWQELAPLLDALLALQPVARAARLHSLELDAELRTLLAGLLDADARVGAQLEAGCEALRADEALAPAPEISGYRIGPLLGSGGMASVFLAERELDGALQRVALKLLRLNVHDPAERRLFRREQAALSRLEHVNIARLIDSGFARDGTPWLAVEYVQGESLLHWCDTRQLGLRARAALFLDICAAVAAAHQASIVHRDLKPANVLVRADGQVKLVDFGIAKLLEADAESTRTELRRLTPAYAAPEQFRGEPAVAGTDIYALGMMLAELLAGTRPAAAQRGDAARLDTRAISGAQAAARGLDAQALRRLLRGDIEAIVAQALRPEPRERYVSVDALAADLRAWLEFRPVAARRGSRRYRLLRFIRRQRVALLSGGLAAAALLAFSLISLDLARRAQLAAEQSRADAQRARQVQDFVLSLFRGDEQGLPEGRATSAAQLAERAVAAARKDLAGQPQALAPLLTAVGELQRNLGRNAESLAVLREAADLARTALGAAHASTLQAEAELAYSQFRHGDYASGAARLEQALRAYRAGGGAEGEALLAAQLRLGMLEMQLGRESTALARLDAAVQLGRRVYRDDHPALQRAVEIYAGALADSGELDRAGTLLADNVARARRLYGDSHVVLASALEALAVVDMNRARLDAAAAGIAEAAAILCRAAPPVHAVSAYVANTEGVIALRRGQAAAARDSFARALQIYAALHAGDHPMIAATQGNLGRAADELADDAAAERHFGEALRISLAVREPGDLRIADFRCQLARAVAARDAAAAQALFRQSLDEFSAAPAAPAMHASCLAQYADLALRLGDTAAAQQRVEQGLALAAHGADAMPALLRLHRVGAQAALRLGDPARASAHQRAAAALPGQSYTPAQSELDRQLLSGLAPVW
jgi:eukaryotic-like serine/threonine-protein kinase